MVSGTTIDIVRNIFFRFCGKSFLPVYLGFNVMNIAESYLMVIFVVSITILGVYFLIAPYIAIIT